MTGWRPKVQSALDELILMPEARILVRATVRSDTCMVVQAINAR